MRFFCGFSFTTRREKVYSKTLSETKSRLIFPALQRLSCQNGINPSKPLNMRFFVLIKKRWNNTSERVPLKSMYIYSKSFSASINIFSSLKQIIKFPASKQKPKPSIFISPLPCLLLHFYTLMRRFSTLW